MLSSLPFWYPRVNHSKSYQQNELRKTMKIYIDADACPTGVKDIIFRVAERRQIETILVANCYIKPPYCKYITTIQVAAGPDVADEKIVELAEIGDLVVTADIPLANFIVEKGAFAVNPRGTLYTEANIKEKLSMRDFMSDLRDTGVQTGGPPPFTQKDCHQFANSLDRFLAKNLKR